MYARTQRQYQQVLDRWTPYMLYRWLSTAGLLAIFFLRIVLAQGVSYFVYSLYLYSFLASCSGTLVCCDPASFYKLLICCRSL
jgi:hypothetical protein